MGDTPTLPSAARRRALSAAGDFLLISLTPQSWSAPYWSGGISVASNATEPEAPKHPISGCREARIWKLCSTGKHLSRHKTSLARCHTFVMEIVRMEIRNVQVGPLASCPESENSRSRQDSCAKFVNIANSVNPASEPNNRQSFSSYQVLEAAWLVRLDQGRIDKWRDIDYLSQCSNAATRYVCMYVPRPVPPP